MRDARRRHSFRLFFACADDAMKRRIRRPQPHTRRVPGHFSALSHYRFASDYHGYRWHITMLQPCSPIARRRRRQQQDFCAGRAGTRRGPIEAACSVRRADFAPVISRHYSAHNISGWHSRRCLYRRRARRRQLGISSDDVTAKFRVMIRFRLCHYKSRLRKIGPRFLELSHDISWRKARATS